MSHYAEVFKCVFSHEFYSASVWTNDTQFKFLVTPTRETAENLRSANCLIKESGSGFKLLCKIEGTKKKTLAAWAHSEPELQLEFHVTTMDREFYNVTSSVEVQDEDSERRNEGTAIYQFKEGQLDSPAIRFFDTPGQIANKPVCIVIVPLDELAKKTISEEEIPQMPIIFRSRSVYWRYNIRGSKKAAFITTIVDRNAGVVFKEVSKAEGKSQRVIQFISKQKIKLKARYDFRFELREQSENGRETVLIDRLPLASPENLTKTPNPGTDLVSDIYVN